MRVILATLIFAAATATAGAATEGLDAVLARRKTMRHIDRPVAQRMDNGALLSVYSDGSVTTQAVRLVKQPAAAVARVEALRDDQATLAAARALAKRVRQGHPKAASSLADAELVAVADDMLDTSTKDKTAAGAIGAAVAAAVAALKNGKKGKEKT